MGLGKLSCQRNVCGWSFWNWWLLLVCCDWLGVCIISYHAFGLLTGCLAILFIHCEFTWACLCWCSFPASVFNFLFFLFGRNIHSNIIFSICIRIPGGDSLEHYVTRMQLSLGSKWSTCPSHIFVSNRANSSSASADNTLGLFRSISPSRVLPKIFRSYLSKAILGFKWQISPSKFWKSLRVLNECLLIF